MTKRPPKVIQGGDALKVDMTGLVTRGKRYYMRFTVPNDLQEKVKGQKVDVSQGDRVTKVTIGKTVQGTLATTDKNQAITRIIAAKEFIEAYWETLRRGPVHLTHKQLLGLAGEYRKAWVAAFDDEPGEPAMWARVLVANAKAMTGQLHPLKIATDDTRRADLEMRFGGGLNGFLAWKRVFLALEQRERLLGLIAEAMNDAARVNLMKASGDYSDGGDTNRYPEYVAAGEGTRQPTAAAMTLTGIIKARVASQAAGRNAAPMPDDTQRKYGRVVAEFVEHRGSDDATTVTPEEIEAWKLKMLEAGVRGNGTIGGYIKNLGTVIEWGQTQSFGRLYDKVNPAKLIELPTHQPVPEGAQTHTLQEAKAILLAARGESRPELRWVPWLCAYSGARVSEIAQLTPSDFFQADERWFYRVTTLGGKHLKNKHSERRVPVHPALIDEGLLKFVLAKGAENTERLFPQRTQGNVANWINDALKLGRAHMRPNHGWRHLFEDMAVKMPEVAKNYITGRSRGVSSEGYGKSEALLPALAELMDEVKRYL